MWVDLQKASSRMKKTTLALTQLCGGETLHNSNEKRRINS